MHLVGFPDPAARASRPRRVDRIQTQKNPAHSPLRTLGHRATVGFPLDREMYRCFMTVHHVRNEVASRLLPLLLLLCTSTACAPQGQGGGMSLGTSSSTAPNSFTLKQISVYSSSLGCGIDSDDRVLCWGENAFGSLGNGSRGAESSSRIPVKVKSALSFSAISSRFARACAVTRNGDVYCWGLYAHGKTGGHPESYSPEFDSDVPMRISGIAEVVEVEVGSSLDCALLRNGTVYCWGGLYGSSEPQLVETDQEFDQLTVGAHHACALTSSGSAYCWGFNVFGELGAGTTQETPSSLSPEQLRPQIVSGDILFSQLSAGESTGLTSVGGHTCGLTPNGSVWCWGRNNAGQLGTENRPDSPLEGFDPAYDRNTPVSATIALTTPDVRFRHVSTARDLSCAIDMDDGLWCWGLVHEKGSDSPGVQLDRPTKVSGEVRFAEFTGICGISLQGSVYCLAGGTIVLAPWSAGE